MTSRTSTFIAGSGGVGGLRLYGLTVLNNVDTSLQKQEQEVCEFGALGTELGLNLQRRGGSKEGREKGV